MNDANLRAERQVSRAPDRAAEIIGALLHSPRTRIELKDYVGMSDDTFVRWRNAMRKAGVLRVIDWRSSGPKGGKPQAVYALQAPFNLPDVQPPKARHG